MAERERWRKVRRAPGYKVSSLGRVRSVDRTLSDGRAAGGVPLERYRDRDGYWCVKIAGETVRVCDLVLEAFDRPRPYGQEACHGDLGQDYDYVTNLRWGTHAENIRDKKRKANSKSEGETYPCLVRTVSEAGQQ